MASPGRRDMIASDHDQLSRQLARRTLLVGATLVVFLALSGCLAIYLVFIHWYTTDAIDSACGDGQYHIQVVEKSTFDRSQWRVNVTISRRKNSESASQNAAWEPVFHDEISTDSCSMGPYSAQWYNREGESRRVEVVGGTRLRSYELDVSTRQWQRRWDAPGGTAAAPVQ